MVICTGDGETALGYQCILYIRHWILHTALYTSTYDVTSGATEVTSGFCIGNTAVMIDEGKGG